MTNLNKSSSQSESFAEACRLYENNKPQEALRIFHMLAKERHIGAMNNIGAMYEAGEGVDKSPQKALYWYKKSVRAGGVASIYNIADLYRKSGNMQLSKKWFTRAVEAKDGDAALELAKLYLNGRSNKNIKEKVKKLLALAADPNTATEETIDEAQKLSASIAR